MDTLIKLLREKNCKITPQRIAIYHALNDSKEHPNAEAIYKKLAPAYPTISLATVYKSLELFSELGLVQVINIGENSFRYDSNTTSHPHVVCNICQRVEDLDNEFFQHLSERVESLCDYKIKNQQLCFYGTCANCIV
ncbi:Fur family transcriptional regulator, peroxide stress response regulator [Natronincola peptidivorans]|uniref:Fur family transcriptional regulator, peroxide stress response regulator n=1 Tax=Natronincola peptidivorans TaxID=426128 RepID=A0A1I0DJ18_9FIRM|nr:Fur family transcriptional regulator [Natronincola peptidivorans]SET32449.1 Fur family transcriptional regulator, peroxide stress response regulator [Natronincola peptidivorans]